MEVRSPQLYQQGMWEKSGHLDHYSDHIYKVENMLLKPMNCPAHVQIFNSNLISYKQLPMRLAEFGCCHRNEPSGSLHGIMRVRQFVQDDAHIFCASEHIETEIKNFCNLLQEAYSRFGFSDISVALSLRPNDRAGDDSLWDHSELILENVLKDLGLPYHLLPGEGAFYGPKLEFSLRDSQGREWQCGTAQLDFILPGRLGAEYVGIDGLRKVPVMIHRAILGSLERFIGILIEHYEGKFPDWLAPEQGVIIPVRESHSDYARKLVEEIGGRISIDDRDEHMMTKVKQHSEMLIPNIIVVGDREMHQGNLSLRRWGAKPEIISPQEFKKLLEK